ncbi:MAG: hypothetical protein JST30_01460 [Armatimonadetes bacterium]|nr:hypothetical protein [Armatimonadota bacterium]
MSHVQSHYGMRVVCRWCASRIDKRDLLYARRNDLAVLVLLAFAVLLLVGKRLLGW